MDSQLIRDGKDVMSIDDLARLDWSGILGQKVSRVHETDRRDVGVSFEPRIEVDYQIRYSSGKSEIRRVLLVLENDARTVVSADLNYNIKD